MRRDCAPAVGQRVAGSGSNIVSNLAGVERQLSASSGGAICFVITGHCAE